MHSKFMYNAIKPKVTLNMVSMYHRKKDHDSSAWKVKIRV